jgi:hypothetical protein
MVTGISVQRKGNGPHKVLQKGNERHPNSRSIRDSQRRIKIRRDLDCSSLLGLWPVSFASDELRSPRSNHMSSIKLSTSFS